MVTEQVAAYHFLELQTVGETWDLVTWYGYMFTFSMQFLTKEIGWMSIDGPVPDNFSYQYH